ncbi:MAG: serine/threonine protein kinase [Polyangiaceae bacterium]|nr:serine/threonine protein kinase [Polyangiaceae bacterium]
MRPLPGTRIGKYRVERPLAEGGMGTIYEATHEGLGTRVALKLLHPQLRERPGFVARFLQEARVAAQLKSPHIVPVLDVDADGAYLVMELLTGETVAQVLARERRLAKDRALDVAIQVLSGLDVAHRAGVVHRDLKPDNVMLVPTRDGVRATILDFGIAKLKASSEYLHGLTRPGATMGTPEYMAPEQAYSADTVDVRADIYAAGVLLYEMLSGKRPATGDDAREIATIVEHRRITSLGVHDPSLPEALVAAVHRAMEPRAAGRFGSAAELALALVPSASVLSLVGHQAIAALSAPAPGTLPSAGSVPKTLPPESPRGVEATAARAPLADPHHGTDFAPPIAPVAMPAPQTSLGAPPPAPPPVAPTPRPTSALAAPLAPAARGRRRKSPTWAIALLAAAAGGLAVTLVLATRDKDDDGPPPATPTAATPAAPAPPPSGVVPTGVVTAPGAPTTPATPTSLPPPPTAPHPSASAARDAGADAGDAGRPMFPGLPGFDGGLPAIPSGLPAIPSGLPPIKIEVPIPIPGFP